MAEAYLPGGGRGPSVRSLTPVGVPPGTPGLRALVQRGISSTRDGLPCPGPAAALSSAGVAFWGLLAGAACVSSGPGEDQGRSDDARPHAHAPGSNPLDVARPNGFRSNPAFVPGRASALSLRSALVTDEGEVAVIEGDARTVSTAGGAFGITGENAAAIVQEILARYGDVFDTVQIYLSFPDEAHIGTAYYTALKNEVAGIGLEIFNARSQYGLSEEGRLSGFSNMNDMRMFGELSTIARAGSPYFALIAQELSHRWTMYLRFMDLSGEVSDVLLGRQGAHWSALAQAYGSFQEGILWNDEGDGTFTAGGTNLGWAPLDLYAMGLAPVSSVEPFFYLEGATLDGRILGRESHRDIAVGSRVRARRIDVTTEDVIAAMGPRSSPAGAETVYHRVALALVTHPGQPRAQWQPYVDALGEVQRELPAMWKGWTSGRSALCTLVRERCPEPVIAVERYAIRDANDGVPACGESFDLEVALRNDGSGPAEHVAVEIAAIEPGLEVRSGSGAVDVIREGGFEIVPGGFRVFVSEDALCPSDLSLEIRATTERGPVFVEEIVISVVEGSSRPDALGETGGCDCSASGRDSLCEGACLFVLMLARRVSRRVRGYAPFRVV